MSGLEPPPVGGSTGLSHAHCKAVDECAFYLVATRPEERPFPLVMALEKMFGLTTLEVMEAKAMAQRMAGEM
ncbi:hypothetical protein ACFOEZ_04145 [Tianweitania populi]|uniref:Uncharacterized protein n=1 Tax=Tianweitania populi TaxID=1607949 RepID=A0A8J3DNR4_9HYPH|nr:hypothetical protein [Tianweitania populi]GHD07717.1 hypothetical protein GCM10016234_06460 [Tianweitania populi]